MDRTDGVQGKQETDYRFDLIYLSSHNVRVEMDDSTNLIQVNMMFSTQVIAY